MVQANSEQHDEIQRLSKALCVTSGEVGIDERRKQPYLLKDGKSRLTGLGPIVTHLVLQSKLNSQLLGKNVAEKALISQWLEFRTTRIDRCSNPVELENIINMLNQYLSNKAYFVGYRLTIADIILYFGLRTIFKNLSFQDKEACLHLSRWFNLVQHSSLLSDPSDMVVFSKTRLFSGTVSGKH